MHKAFAPNKTVTQYKCKVNAGFTHNLYQGCAKPAIARSKYVGGNTAYKDKDDLFPICAYHFKDEYFTDSINWKVVEVYGEAIPTIS